MKILSISQIKEADVYTIKNEPIASIDLMERASLSIVKWFTQRFESKNLIYIFCGTGNNGGDGLAIARLLIQKKYQVKIFLIGEAKGSADFQVNYDRLKTIVSIQHIKSQQDIPEIPGKSIVFDAIFGSGLTRPVEGVYASVIKAINDSKASKVLAVDIASGLFADKPSTSRAIVTPDITLSFQTPKLAFFLPQNEPYVGDYEILDIKLSSEYLGGVETPYSLLTAPFIARMFKPRKKYAHKGDFGRALIIAGSKGKIGAAILSCRACLRSGVGLLTAHTPSNCWPIMQTAVHEAMVDIDEQEDYFSGAKNIENYNVIGIGPGLGTEEITINGFKEVLENYKKPIVFDADALNILGKEPELKGLMPEGSVLTPHPKEFERIAGTFDNDFDRLELQKDFSKKHKVYVLLKGAHSSVSTPDGKVFFNATGNSGMATGGSGDILTGIVTAFLAQQYHPLEATLISVFVHGFAADIAAEKLGKEALLPSDIIDCLGEAFINLHQKAYIPQ